MQTDRLTSEASHLTHETLNDILKDKRIANEKAQIRDHLKCCRRCSELVAIVTDALEIRGRSQARVPVGHFSRFELSDLVAKLYDNSLPAQDAANFLEHLQTCSRCFDDLSLMFAESLQPIPEAVKADLGAYEGISIAQKVLEARPGLFVERPARRPSFWQRYAPAVQGWFQRTPRFAFALLAFVMVTLGSFGGYRYYHTTYQIHKARELLRENVTFYIKDRPRLSGGYASRGIDVTLSGEETATEGSYLQEALRHTDHAIARGTKSTDAKLLQAQIFILTNQYDRADSILNRLVQPGRARAKVLNDLGVLKFKQEDWQGAVDYFTQATQADSQFKEAYYNLALAQEKLGLIQEAISTLQHYLQLETDEGWRRAATSYLNRLQQHPG